MKIDELSSTLDDKLSQAETQLQALQYEHTQAQDQITRRRLERDMAALVAVHKKLTKSRALAWQVHELNSQAAQDKRSIERQRRLGLGLIIASGLGLVVLGWVAYGMYF